MARRRAQFLMYGNDAQCTDLIKFIEESGVTLDIRDLAQAPLTEEELGRLIGHCDIQHFLNPLSKAYEKHSLGDNHHSREELLTLMATDNTLVRQPILRTSRLTTIGCDQKTISDVLLMANEGIRIPEEVERGRSKPKKNGKSSKSHKASAASGR
jgi:arsenate reductase-like glutaredoxin family protein